MIFEKDTLYADDREEKSGILVKLAKKEIKFVKCRLDVGDFVYNDMVFERKSIIDFYGSIQGRMFEQVENMKANYPEVYVLVSGRFAECYARLNYFNEKVIHGAIASLVAKHRIHVLRVENDNELIAQMMKICEKSGEPITQIVRRIALTDDDVYTNMLACVPGIGMIQARKILEKLKFWQILQDDGTQLQMVEGIGEKKANEIKKYFKI